jgi:hypothetical protein
LAICGNRRKDFVALQSPLVRNEKPRAAGPGFGKRRRRRRKRRRLRSVPKPGPAAKGNRRNHRKGVAARAVHGKHEDGTQCAETKVVEPRNRPLRRTQHPQWSHCCPLARPAVSGGCPPPCADRARALRPLGGPRLGFARVSWPTNPPAVRDLNVPLSDAPNHCGPRSPPTPPYPVHSLPHLCHPWPPFHRPKTTNAPVRPPIRSQPLKRRAVPISTSGTVCVQSEPRRERIC